jgi:hypothetical protein
MKDLGKNIRLLLLENDCVIVPDLGGFIAHYQPAHYEAAERCFYPPVRTIGFNPQLTLNDGLLAQLYMQKYHTDFPDATYRIRHAVEALKDVLYEEGRVQIDGVGELCFNLAHNYEFHPMSEGSISPSLYGLDMFVMPKLSQHPRQQVFPSSPFVGTPVKVRRISKRRLASHLAAAAVAIFLFFALSTPVENTYVDNGNYASLGTDVLFDAIRSQSLVTSVVNPTMDQDKKKEKTSTKDSKKNNTSSSKSSQKESSSAKKDSAKKDSSKESSKKDSSKKNNNQQQPANNNQQPQQPNNNQQPQQPNNNQSQQPNDKPANNNQPAVSSTGSKLYHLIVSSLTTLADAKNELNKFIQKGYTNATIVEGNGRYRISLGDYSDLSTANKQLNELKKDDAYKGAWLLRN